ncbi:SpoVG family protein [Hungatella sp.]|uniref:SpoVG family protein n=1 Tax=Hungatella sp. TaxID=2613924 RepID=UPI002A82DD87|nr:SpoVG family protein [Hungatella sp.]
MPRAKATPTPAPQEEAVHSSLTYDVRIYPVKTDGALKANATVNLNDEFALTNIRVMEGSKGLFVSMPQYRGRNGEYKDICFPCTKESRAGFNNAVLSAYQQVIEQKQSETQKQEAPNEQQQEQSNQPEMAAM